LDLVGKIKNGFPYLEKRDGEVGELAVRHSHDERLLFFRVLGVVWLCWLGLSSERESTHLALIRRSSRQHLVSS
jgi:hypothetical protein